MVSIDGNYIVCLQYYFDREERSIVAKESHGNSKKEIAFILTKPSVVEKIKNSGKIPKAIVSNVLHESGGFEDVQEQNDLVRNRQIYDTKSNVKEEKDEVVEVMDLYKREQNSQLHFIR